MSGIFADISSVLVQEILHLREALEFYEIELFNPQTPEIFGPADKHVLSLGAVARENRSVQT